MILMQNAETYQLVTICMDDDCSTDDKYRAAKELQIRFKVSEYRKVPARNEFNPDLSSYWQKIFDKTFKGWDE